MAQIVCPYCLHPQSGVRIQTCQNPNCPVHDIPAEYVESARRKPPIWLTMFGASRHGKTSIVSSLNLWLEMISKLIADADCEYLDDYTVEQMRRMRISDKEGEVALASTQKGMRPLLIRVRNLIPNHEQTLVIYDLPGEVLDDAQQTAEYAAAIRYTQTVWFVVSLEDLAKDKEGNTIPSLFATYISAMKRLNAPVEGRNMLVVFTKGDLLLEPKYELPDEVAEYLSGDPYKSLRTERSGSLKPFDLDSYTNKLIKTSDELRDYTFEIVDGGSQFITRTRANKIKSLAFCITASMPGADKNDIAPTKIERFRVLDPLLWTLHYGGGSISTASAVLIIESGSPAEPLFNAELPVQVADSLLRRSIGVAPYYSGSAKPISAKNGIDELKPSIRRLNVIGQILENLDKQSPESTNLAVFLTATEPHDLRDFMYSSWADRLIVITLDSSIAEYWEKRIVIDDDTDLDEWLNNYLPQSSDT